MAVKSILFDLDGTLSDTIPDIILAVNRLRQSCGLETLPGDTVRSFVGDGIAKLLQRSLNGTGIPAEQVMGDFQKIFAECLNQESRLYPGVYEGLLTLNKAGIRLALLSNKPEDYCKYILYDFGIGNLFDAIFGGCEEYPLKPDPESSLAILDIFGLEDEKESVWFLGDSHVDLATARNAGLHRAFAAWGYGQPLDETYEQKFGSFAEFTDFILKEQNK